MSFMKSNKKLRAKGRETLSDVMERSKDRAVGEALYIVQGCAKKLVPGCENISAQLQPAGRADKKPPL